MTANPNPLVERHNVADEVECSKRWGSHYRPVTVIFPGHKVCVLPPDTGAGAELTHSVLRAALEEWTA